MLLSAPCASQGGRSDSQQHKQCRVSGRVTDLTVKNVTVREAVTVWTYWYLQEGAIECSPSLLSTTDGHIAPVLHIDSDALLIDDSGNLIIAEGVWASTLSRI
ncbi:MAG: hypothetical protein DLM67_12750 [Candidatus Nephthysia bennettiae]|nr:MAG: hypothetical protein DLM67_12750 [Candidatus Dormibacteraeota bacterium]